MGRCTAFRTFQQGGIFIVPHPLWHGTLVFQSYPKDRPIQSPLATRKGMQRAYSYLMGQVRSLKHDVTSYSQTGDDNSATIPTIAMDSKERWFTSDRSLHVMHLQYTGIYFCIQILQCTNVSCCQDICTCTYKYKSFQPSASESHCMDHYWLPIWLLSFRTGPCPVTKILYPSLIVTKVYVIFLPVIIRRKIFLTLSNSNFTA
jgi:hypothetical protein